MLSFHNWGAHSLLWLNGNSSICRSAARIVLLFWYTGKPILYLLETLLQLPEMCQNRLWTCEAYGVWAFTYCSCTVDTVRHSNCHTSIWDCHIFLEIPAWYYLTDILRQTLWLPTRQPCKECIRMFLRSSPQLEAPSVPRFMAWYSPTTVSMLLLLLCVTESSWTTHRKLVPFNFSVAMKTRLAPRLVLTTVNPEGKLLFTAYSTSSISQMYAWTWDPGEWKVHCNLTGFPSRARMSGGWIETNVKEASETTRENKRHNQSLIYAIIRCTRSTVCIAAHPQTLPVENTAIHYYWHNDCIPASI